MLFLPTTVYPPPPPAPTKRDTTPRWLAMLKAGGLR